MIAQRAHLDSYRDSGLCVQLCEPCGKKLNLKLGNKQIAV